MEQSEIVNLIIETINSIFSNLFSSIDNNVYSNLDNYIFFSSDIINNNLFEKLLGKNGKNGLLYLADALFVAIILYYSVRLSYSHLSGNNVERPSQFILKMIIVGIFINCSYFICEQIIEINFLISESIREIGESIINKPISFNSLIHELNSTISIGNNSFDLFSFDGIIKSFITVGLLNLLFSYSLRYIMVQAFIVTVPIVLLALINSSTYWIVKAWFKVFFSLLSIQIFVPIILIIMLSIDYQNKILLIGAIYALIRSNTYVSQIIGGINVDVSSNLSSIISSFKR